MISQRNNSSYQDAQQSLLSLQQKLVIDIDLKTQDHQLEFSLRCNGYYENINGILQQNAGLSQVMKRIQALYPGRHQKDIHLENGMFSLNLTLNTENIVTPSDNKSQMKPAYEPA